MNVGEEKGIKNLLKISGYSSTAIEYFLGKVNVGEIEDSDAYFVYNLSVWRHNGDFSGNRTGLKSDKRSEILSNRVRRHF